MGKRNIVENVLIAVWAGVVISLFTLARYTPFIIISYAIYKILSK